MGRNSYSDDFKAEVMAVLLKGQSVSQVAREYDIPRSTVANWSSKARQTSVPVVTEEGEQDNEVGVLLMDYLKRNLQALRVQATAFQDEQWLKEQSAAEAATLHGVMTDKAVRLMEAISKAQNEPSPPHRLEQVNSEPANG